MLTPKELYESYSITPCKDAYNMGNPAVLSVGKGSPYDLNRIIRFLKHVVSPCYAAIDTSDIDNTGDGRLAVPFRFLQQLDAEAFLEGQTGVAGGTAYAVRNAADFTRACYLVSNNQTQLWSAKMATEYLEHFCGNSLPDCLMMLGPDLVPEAEARDQRTPSSLGCGFYYGAGSRHFCYMPPIPNPDPVKYPECTCGVTPDGFSEPECTEGDTRPCCFDEPDRENLCCKVGKTSRADFSYSIPVDDMSSTPSNKYIMKHIGILERKDYGGYANFVNRSGQNFNAIMDDTFLNYFRDDHQPPPFKCKTISTILSISKPNPYQVQIDTDTSYIVSKIKDLIYNGYGLVLLSNVGFPNLRDSTGLCYPDRIWYQTYNIVGYDDRKIEYPECVYVLSCPFGNWIDGGHPSWGPLPPSCFLVTETHLKCMLKFSPGMDFYNCRQRYCNPVLYECSNPIVMQQFNGCHGAPQDGQCYPYYCTPEQLAFGMVFAMSLSSGFPKQNLDYSDFYPVSMFREQTKEQTVYFDPN